MKAKEAWRYRKVALKSANCARVSLVIGTLAASVLVLGKMMTPAQATFPGKNGKIAYSHGGGPSSIYVVNADGTGRTNVVPDADTDTNTTPAWSPDGTMVAFSSSMHSSGSELYPLEIYVMDADGNNLRRLTYNDTDDTDPTWSPDGTKIAYTSYGETGFEIYTVNTNGSNLAPLTNNPERAEDLDSSGNLTRYKGNSEPVWLPDGKKIAFQVDSRPPSRSGTYTMNPDGSNQTMVTVNGDQPDWSSDCTKMAYRYYPPGQGDSDIYIADADGSNPVNLTARIGGASYELLPDWSPDGTKITFASNVDEKEGYEIYVVDVDGRNLRRLTAVPGPDSYPNWQALPAATPAKYADCSDIAQVTTNSGVNDVDPGRQTQPGPTEAEPEKQQEQRQQNQQQQQPQQGSKNRSVTVHQPDTGGPSLLLVASFLLFSGGVMFYGGVKRSM